MGYLMRSGQVGGRHGLKSYFLVVGPSPVTLRLKLYNGLTAGRDKERPGSHRPPWTQLCLRRPVA